MRAQSALGPMTACGRAGLKYLEQNSKKEGVVTTSSGLQYKVC